MCAAARPRALPRAHARAVERRLFTRFSRLGTLISTSFINKEAMGALSKEEGAGPNASKIVLTSAFLQYVALPGSLRPAASASQRSLTASSPLPAPSLRPLSPQLLPPQLLPPQL